MVLVLRKTAIPETVSSGPGTNGLSRYLDCLGVLGAAGHGDCLTMAAIIMVFQTMRIFDKTI
jgi:hypothetical protein